MGLNKDLKYKLVMSMAERELGAFISAVTDSYGPEEASASAEDWIEEFESSNLPPGFESREWRQITIAAAARLANRVVEFGPGH